MSVDDAVLQVAGCPGCGRAMWPPVRHCPHCLHRTVRRDMAGRGRILEYAQDGSRYLCVAEFEGGVRLVCALDSDATPAVGQAVRLERMEEDGSGCRFFAGVVAEEQDDA